MRRSRSYGRISAERHRDAASRFQEDTNVGSLKCAEDRLYFVPDLEYGSRKRALHQPT